MNPLARISHESKSKSRRAQRPKDYEGTKAKSEPRGHL